MVTQKGPQRLYLNQARSTLIGQDVARSARWWDMKGNYGAPYMPVTRVYMMDEGLP